MSTISTTVENDKLAQVLQATGIPFLQTCADLWARANDSDPEPGDERRTYLKYTGTWTAEEDLALEWLLSEGVITGISRSGPDPFPFEEKIATIHKAAAVHPALQETRSIRIENPRYVVVPKYGVVSAIIDTKGQNPPYEIGTNERRQSETGRRQRSWAFNRSVAEDWAYIWNLVELGHCGLCKRKISEIPGYQSGPNGEPPRHQHTFGHRMYHALCFGCSCSLDD